MHIYSSAARSSLAGIRHRESWGGSRGVCVLFMSPESSLGLLRFWQNIQLMAYSTIYSCICILDAHREQVCLHCAIYAAAVMGNDIMCPQHVRPNQWMWFNVFGLLHTDTHHMHYSAQTFLHVITIEYLRILPPTCG